MTPSHLRVKGTKTMGIDRSPSADGASTSIASPARIYPDLDVPPPIRAFCLRLQKSRKCRRTRLASPAPWQANLSSLTNPMAPCSRTTRNAVGAHSRGLTRAKDAQTPKHSLRQKGVVMDARGQDLSMFFIYGRVVFLVVFD